MYVKGYVKILLIVYFLFSLVFPYQLFPKDISQAIAQIIPVGDMNQIDFKALEVAQKVAEECSLIFEDAINKGLISEKELFCDLYFPILPLRSPPTFTTFYDTFCDKYIKPIEDKYLKENPFLLYVVIVDRNGYVPSHNSKYSKPLTGIPEIDLKTNRTKRIFNDITGFWSAKSQKDFLLQAYRRDTGEIIADLSVPLYINGKHWGAVRVGYNRIIGGIR